MELIEKTKVLDLIQSKIPWDIPEWLSLIILGFIVAIAIYAIVRIGSVIFKIVLTIVVILLIYLAITGNLPLPFITDSQPKVQIAQAVSSLFI